MNRYQCQLWTKYERKSYQIYNLSSTIKLNKIRRVSGQRLQEAWNSIPHVTQFDKCNISEFPSFLQWAIFDAFNAAMSNGKFLNSIYTKPFSIKSFLTA